MTLEPMFPLVVRARKILWPRALYFKRVPPQRNSISSGCEPKARMFIEWGLLEG
jgi:hypothetical protein